MNPPPDPAWRQHATCRGSDVNLFYIDRADSVDHQPHPAKQICARCPVTGPCLEEGLRDNHGVWGGTTPRERRRIRRQRRQPPVIPTANPDKPTNIPAFPQVFP